MSDADWTEDKVAKLREIWAAGATSGAIAAAIGMSKNAVVGKAHRLGLPGRPSPIKQGGPAKQIARAPAQTLPALPTVAAVKAPAANMPATAPRKAAQPAQPAPTPPAPIRHAQPGEPCCWPIGDPGRPDFRFCGEAARPGRPYCQAHVDIAYVRTSTQQHEDAA